MTSASTLEWSPVAKVAVQILALQVNFLMAGHVLMMFLFCCFLCPPGLELFMPNGTISVEGIVRLAPNCPVVDVLL